MCGIAAYSLSSRSSVERTLAAQALLAAIAERGADAVGYAYRRRGETYPTVVKQRTPASELLERVSVPDDATHLLVHVRDYTKGHPSIPANNHPVRHGPVVGIHNGIIANDDEILEQHPCARSEPIFAVAAHSKNDPRALEQLHGSMAAAWIDEREPNTLFAARGIGRPLWTGEGPGGVFVASTKLALEVVERYSETPLRKSEVAEGTALVLREGKIVRRQAFRPDRTFVEGDPLPAVRAPHERETCLTALATLAAAA